MTKVYTKIDGKLALFKVDTADHDIAIITVKQELGTKHKVIVLVLLEQEIQDLVA